MKTLLIKRNDLADLIAALLIFLLVYTVISKLLNFENFKILISRLPLLNEVSGFISWLIPIFEILVSLLLFIPKSRQTGLLLSVTLMGCFILYLGYMLLFASHLQCSCGGVIEQMTWSQHLIFNIVFFLFSLLAWIIKRNPNKDFIAINRQSRTPV